MSRLCGNQQQRAAFSMAKLFSLFPQMLSTFLSPTLCREVVILILKVNHEFQRSEAWVCQ